jgi:hypothetical protein
MTRKPDSLEESALAKGGGKIGRVNLNLKESQKVS